MLFIIIILYYKYGFADTVSRLRGKSAAAFAQVFVDLLDEIKHRFRQSIFTLGAHSCNL